MLSNSQEGRPRESVENLPAGLNNFVKKFIRTPGEPISSNVNAARCGGESGTGGFKEEIAPAPTFDSSITQKKKFETGDIKEVLMVFNHGYTDPLEYAKLSKG